MKRYKRATLRCYLRDYDRITGYQDVKVNLYKDDNNKPIVSWEGSYEFVKYNKDGKYWELEELNETN